MRKIAPIKKEYADTRWVMLYESEEGVYLFPFISDTDGSVNDDFWFETSADAEEDSYDRWGVKACDWIEIPDPISGAQHDWVAPVRVTGRETGTPRWGSYERLIDGEWVGFDPASESWFVREAIQQVNR
ncbi:MAG: hypothetical protein AB2L09_01505 [Coriobacteriia bacterium]